MTTYERALQIYTVLIAASHNRQTLTYELLGKTTGMPAHGLANHLEKVLQYCARNGLPPLTLLVVRKTAGSPSHGFHGSEDLDLDRERVYTHEWFKMRPPAANDFQQAAGESEVAADGASFV